MTQREEALEKANHVRVFRRDLKRQISAGELSVQAVLLAQPWEAATMTVYDLLKSRPRWGRTKTVSFLHRHRVSESQTVGGLTTRQRAAIVEHLNGQGPMTMDMSDRQVAHWQQEAAA